MSRPPTSNLEALIRCAGDVVRALASREPDMEELGRWVRTILTEKTPIELAEEGLITREEAVNLFLAHIEHRTMNRYTLSWEGKPEIPESVVRDAERLLFDM